MMIRVVKLGGSLIAWPLMPAALRGWLSDQPPAFNVFIPGGGGLADTVRQADRNFALGEETSHWLCIDALSVAAQIIAAILPELGLIANYDALRAESSAPASHAVVFDPREFLRDHEWRLAGRVLPHAWSVTSDSIAARLAQVLTADELVLLKSCDPPETSLPDLAIAGYVDKHFPNVELGRTPLRLINLRKHAKSSALALHLGGKLR